MSKTLREQLRPLSRWISQLPPSPNSWRKEGEDHINVDRLSQTHLGRSLCMDSITAWEHPVLGRFTSLNNFWYFLKAKNRVDALRTIHPRDLRVTVEKSGGRRKEIKNFMQIVLWGVYYRVKYISALTREIQKTELPFDSYRANQAGVRSRNNTAHWLIEGYEEIRQALKEEREPDFNRIAPLEGNLEDLHNEIVSDILNQPKVSVAVEQPKPRKPKKKMGHRRIDKVQESTEKSHEALEQAEVQPDAVEAISTEEIAKQMTAETAVTTEDSVKVEETPQATQDDAPVTQSSEDTPTSTNEEQVQAEPSIPVDGVEATPDTVEVPPAEPEKFSLEGMVEATPVDNNV